MTSPSLEEIGMELSKWFRFHLDNVGNCTDHIQCLADRILTALRSQREAALEEAAKIADRCASHEGYECDCAKQIRALLAREGERK